MNTELTNRQILVKQVIELLCESGWDMAAKKLTNALARNERVLDLNVELKDDCMIIEAFRAVKLGHAYLNIKGVTYIIK